MGPNAVADGGRVIAKGTVEQIKANPDSRIGPFLAERQGIQRKAVSEDVFGLGAIHMATSPIHTVRALNVNITTAHRLTAHRSRAGS